jgi:hypothetical protein
MPTGYNENVEVEGLRYHVQTEDVGDRNEIVSQVFLDGRVLHTYRFPYADWRQEAGWEQRVAEQARRQHALMVAAAERGRLKPKSEGEQAPDSGAP